MRRSSGNGLGTKRVGDPSQPGAHPAITSGTTGSYCAPLHTTRMEGAD